jgi:hypothetical protein
MIIDRRTFIVKKGHWDTAIGLLRELKQKGHETGIQTMRIYSSMIGPFDTIAYEMEIENLAVWEREIAAFYAFDEQWFTAWFERWLAATEPGGALEIWQLEG